MSAVEGVDAVTGRRPARDDGAPAATAPAVRRRWLTAGDRPHLLVETVLVLLLLTVYDRIKNVVHARPSVAMDHGFSLLKVEDALRIGIEASTNRWLAGHAALGWLSSYFYEFAWCFVAIGALVVCYLRRPDVYRPARNAMFLINAVGLAVFFAYPAAPPRLLPGTSYRDIVAEAGFGVAHDGRLPADEYAAMPSLHLGWSIFAAILICRLTRRRVLRVVAVAYPVVTAVVVVASANHYVLDVVAGTVLAVVGSLLTGLLPGLRRGGRPPRGRVLSVTRFDGGSEDEAATAGVPDADLLPTPATVSVAAAPGTRARRVLIVSASIGAGHDGAAAELRRRLEERGYTVEVRDFLDALVGPVGWLFKSIYGGMLRAVPGSYDWLYWSIERRSWLERLARWFAGWSSFALRRWLRQGADIVVSTYPLASQALGRLRRRGELRVPLITYLTDMSVSKMWVHSGVDLHLACSDETAQQARAAGAGATVVTGPLVPARFTPDHDPAVRQRVRAGLGLGPQDHVALLVAGSWGVGDVEATARELLETGIAVPVVVCGRNTDLLDRLQAVEGVVAVGWTDVMHELMCAADVLVQNAGGLSCMEAFATGLPAVSYRCIPGHGEHNAGVMDRIGIAPWARTPGQLTHALRVLTDAALRQAQVARAAATFRSDPAGIVLERATGSDGIAFSPHRQRRVRTAVASLASVGVLTWAGTGGVAAAASHGVGVVHPAPSQHGAVFLVVRAAATDDFSPAVVDQLSRLHASVVVDRALARRQPQLLPRLTAAGIDLVLQGSKSLRLARVPAEPARGHVAGVRPFVLVNDRRPDAMDLGLAYLREDNLVSPSSVIHGGGEVPSISGGNVVLVDLRHRPGGSLAAELGALQASVARASLTPDTLGDLQGIRT